ncbi:MAG: ATP-binding protein [Candidatus Dormibacteria bacterium]
MTYSFLGPDPVETQIAAALTRLAAGDRPDQIERAQVDVKEEVGRRGLGGRILPGAAQNDEAARYLAGELACMANTPGGGAIVLGVADDGTRIGTELDPEWLRHRIWQLTERRLTVAVRAVDLNGTGILVLTTHEAIEPIRFEGKLKWRVNDNCVEVDPTSWHAGKLQRSGLDWSAQPSGHVVEEASPVAVEIARRYLQAAGDEAATDLSLATAHDLLRRLNLAVGDGRLTNAGSLLFVGTPEVGIDYIRRDVAGSDSTNRVRSARPLLEQVWDVDQASQASNRLVHVPEGFVHGQLRAIPSRAVREAIVNGVVHRDWLSPEPTTVEHVGDLLTVTSPGGFIGGITPSNIITHPAVPRYRSLAEAMATLRLAEREGIGVDRMVRDMLAIGRPEPEISEITGPYVRIGLVGGVPDTQVIEFLSSIEPATVPTDVDALLLIAHLRTYGWADEGTAAPTLQRPIGETADAVNRLAAALVDGEPVITPIKGVPANQPVAYRLGDAGRRRLAHRIHHLETPEGRKAQILAWATSRGRVSSTEVADMAGLSVPYAGILLTGLEEEGLLAPGRENKLGRGFHYVPATRSS